MTNTTTTTTIDFGTITTDAAAAIYADADNATKARLRADADAAVRDYIMADDYAAAKNAATVRDTFKTAPKSTEVDYAQLVADHYATLKAAVEAMDLGHYTLPEGVDADAADGWADKVGVAGSTDHLIVVKGRKAGRGAVVAWIESVVDDTPTKIADLRKRWVPTTDYPKSAPSAGAIGAAFNRVMDGADADFIVVDVDGAKGAVSA